MNTPRPHLLITAHVAPGLRTVADVRSIIGDGLPATLWRIVQGQADADLDTPPLTPATPLPHRHRDQVTRANRDYTICHAVAVRLLSAAMCWLVTEDRRYLDSAMRQMRCLFDRRIWPEWRDLSHPPPADLRTGQLALPVGLVYDWLHTALTPDQRCEIIASLDDQAVQPYMQALPDAWWFNGRNNWLTVIVGGMGVAGMAMAGDHPQSASLVDTAVRKMRDYLSVYGPEGEFNESPMYANANHMPVDFFQALGCHAAGAANPLADHPFPAMCRWVMQTTEPWGYPVAFGDTPLDMPVMVDYIAPVAAAAHDPTLQAFFLRHVRLDSFLHHGNPVLQLLGFDPTLPPAPEQQWNEPLAKAYSAHGGIIASRTGWSAATGICVYSKSGQTEAHGHHDAGQVLIGGYGKRLITDPGSLNYPADYFDPVKRYCYYNASVMGHNVVCIDGRETRHLDGRLVEFFSQQGTVSWTIDLTPCHQGASLVRRSVRHHVPAVIAVLDEVQFPETHDIALRWHTGAAVDPQADGSFVVELDGVHCAGRVVRLDGTGPQLSAARHEYRSPYDRNRLGGLLEQKHEPYTQADVHDASCRLLTLFAVFASGEPAERWEACGAEWRILTREGIVSVSVQQGRMVSRVATLV